MHARRRVWPDGEESIIYLCVALIGAIPVILTLVRGGVFDREATLGLLMVGFGAYGTVGQLTSRRR